jgi:ADP-heptose:LPS heptosyltransferase
LYNHILLITLSNIGDAIMTTPVLQALHAMYPEAKIDIVADRRSSEIFLHCPYRGKIYHKEKQKLMRGVLSLLKSLLKRKYGLIVDLRTDGLAYLLRADKRLTKWQRKPYGPHAVERHIGVISSLYGNSKIPECHIWIDEKDRLFAKETLGSFTNKRLLGLGPGANWPGKIWPKEKYLALTERLKDLFDAVILLGDIYDREYSEYISNNTKLPCMDLCGRTSLLQTVAVQELLEIFIGNDSGLGHIASATGTPSLTIFGPGSPDRYHPWGENSFWIEGKDKIIENVSVDDVVSLLKCNQIYSPTK